MNAENLRNILVPGTGNMGPGVAVLFARYGYEVSLWAHSPTGKGKGESDCRTITEDLSRAGLLDAGEAAAVMGRVQVTEDLEEAAAQADFVSESIVENIDAKKELYARIQAVGPAHCVIASNTSTLLPSDLRRGAPAPERILVAHFWNPAHLVPLVEVCGGPGAAPEAVEITASLLRRVGKEPVIMKDEILGFIGNRLMHAMYREALALVDRGIIDAAGIDRVVLASFGPRFANLGPLEYLDYIGLDHIRRIQAYLYDDLESSGGVSPTIDSLVDAGRLGRKTGAGLYDWSGKDADDVRRRRDYELLRRLTEAE